MARTLGDLARDLRQEADELDLSVPRAIREVAIAVLQPLISSTPVDTGRARSNWVVSIDQPARSVLEPYVDGAEGSTEGANTRAALEAGLEVIAGFSTSEGEIWITNNLPYIQRLNEGWSAQAPAGFVEEAVQIGAQAASQARL